MKKHIYSYLLLMVCLLGTTFIKAATTEHRLGVSIEGGYTMRVSNNLNHAQGGVGGVGGVYELQHSHFLFHVALSAQYEFMHTTVPNQQVDVPNVVDEVGDVATMHYHLNDIQADDHLVLPNLSLMVGGAWNRFYFMLGGKIGVTAYQRQSYQTSYTVTATYPFFDTELGQMPQHALVTDELHQSKTQSSLSLIPYLGCELGTSFRIGHSGNSHLLRVGLFGELGIAYNRIAASVLSGFDQTMESYLKHSVESRLTLGVRCTLLFNVSSNTSKRCMCVP